MAPGKMVAVAGYRLLQGGVQSPTGWGAGSCRVGWVRTPEAQEEKPTGSQNRQ